MYDLESSDWISLVSVAISVPAVVATVAGAIDARKQAAASAVSARESRKALILHARPSLVVEWQYGEAPMQTQPRPMPVAQVGSQLSVRLTFSQLTPVTEIRVSWWTVDGTHHGPTALDAEQSVRLTDVRMIEHTNPYASADFRSILITCKDSETFTSWQETLSDSQTLENGLQFAMDLAQPI